VSRALVIGVVFAVACLAYVLLPLIARGRGHAAGASNRGGRRVVTDDEIEAAIRSYRATSGAAGVCPMCGPRPESDAMFCSNCGRRLDGAPGSK
jgi:hypothetical protein